MPQRLHPLPARPSGTLLSLALCLPLLLALGCGSPPPDQMMTPDPYNPGPRPGNGGYGSGSGSGMNNPDQPPMCAEADRQCAHEFVYQGSMTLPLNGKEKAVEIRGDWLQNFAQGVAMTFDGKAWRGTAAVPWSAKVLYKFHIIYMDNSEKWVPDPANPDITNDGYMNSILMGLTCVKWTCAPSMCSGPSIPGAYDWRDAVMYFVFVDRFNDGHPGHNMPVSGVDTRANWQGGDWKGVTQKINAGYFNDLGVNTLWLTVPMDNSDGSNIGQDGVHLYTAYHGYWPRDLYKPEYRFGTEADLHELIDAAHAKGLKVLLDYAMNHVHTDSPVWQTHKDDGWFNPLMRSGQKCICGSGICPWDGPSAKYCWFTDYLADLDYNNNDARKYSVDNVISWVDKFNADALRLDAIKHVELSWLTDVRDRLNKDIEPLRKQHIYLVGETFTGDQGFIKTFVDPCKMLDGQFDFPLRASLNRTVLLRNGSMKDLVSFMDKNTSFYGSGVMSTFIGNHDVPRVIHYAEDAKPGWINDEWNDSGQMVAWQTPPAAPGGTSAYERVALAMSVLMTNQGVPLIYYGDEFGMPGAGDPDNRRLMIFDGYTAGQQFLLQRMKKLGALRAAHVALRQGDRTTLFSDDEAWAYQMLKGTDRVYVVLNRGDGQKTVSGLPMGTFTDQLTGESVSGPSVTVAARGVRILIP